MILTPRKAGRVIDLAKKRTQTAGSGGTSRFKCGFFDKTSNFTSCKRPHPQGMLGSSYFNTGIPLNYECWRVISNAKKIKQYWIHFIPRAFRRLLCRIGFSNGSEEGRGDPKADRSL